MTHRPHILLVSAIVLINTQDQILLTKRPSGKDMSGLWEFPGGKVHADETPEAALVREATEELGIAIKPGDLKPLTFASHSYEKFHLLMPLYACHIWQNKPSGLEGQQLCWVNAPDLHTFDMPPADIPLIAPIQSYLSMKEAA